jgi:hypothetical protein
MSAMATRSARTNESGPDRPTSAFDMLMVLFIVGVAVAIVVGVSG